MYGLFCNTYDYYEWHDLVCVSASEGDLIAYYWKMKSEGTTTYPLVLMDSETFAEEEKGHYVIEPVKVV